LIKINPNITESENHFHLVKGFLIKRIETILRLGYINKNSTKIYVSQNLRNYLNDLKNEVSLKLLILSSPKNLENLSVNIKANSPLFTTTKSDDNLILRNIFINHGYDNDDFCKSEFIKRVNIDTCPYCNRNYIYYLSKSSNIKPQIDHFFPKSIYPFFALSYYNLIPSCQTCNGFGAKEEKDPMDEGLINPYLISNDNFKFTYKIKSVNVVNPLADKYSIEVTFKDKIPGHLNVFKLDKLYSQHSDHVLELIVKSKILYSEKYKEYLDSYDGLKFNKSEINRMILGNYSEENELHKRPLTKLYQDIGRKLKLID
jgi:hypothetical protein